jgi:hypothetical protein
MDMDRWNWTALELEGRGPLSPTLERHVCVPAWDITAVYAEADEWLAHPDPSRAERCAIFWNRQLDRRFSLTYPHSRREGPRVIGRSVTDPREAWDRVEAERKRILRESGLGPDAKPAAVARALADWFLFDRFAQRVTCPAFSSDPRTLSSGFEAVFYQSNCHGCARAYAILGDMSGLATRNIGCGGHIVAEVRLDDQWIVVDSAGRRDPELGAFFNTSYIQSYVRPGNDFGVRINERFRHGLFKRPNPQFHFHHGQWDGPLTLRWSMQAAAALYPQETRIPCKAEPGLRLPLIRYARGFYWPIVHSSDTPLLEAARRQSLQHRDPGPVPDRDYLYHRFEPGQCLRHTFTLADLAGVVAVELTLTFDAASLGHWGRQNADALRLWVNGRSHRLGDLASWPMENPGNPVFLTVTLPSESLRTGTVNEVMLEHTGKSAGYMPAAPGVLEGLPPALGMR